MKLTSALFLNSFSHLYKIVSKPALLSHDQLCYSLSALRYFSSGMDLEQVVDRLKKYASPSLAATWDNVGLLVEPSAPHRVSRILLTNDLTQEVATEATTLKVDMIISYHPPIFQPVKRLTQESWKDRVIVQCIENRIAIYSPHTSYDILHNGLSDWLAAAFVGKFEPVTQSFDRSFSKELTLSIRFPNRLPDCMEEQLVKAFPDAVILGHHRIDSHLGESGVRLDVTCTKKLLPQLTSFLESYELTDLQIIERVKPPLSGHGEGRLVTLDHPMTIKDAILLIKSHLKLAFVRLGLGQRKTTESQVRTIAVCAGSGSSVLRGVKADLYLTGEMPHHDVLDAVQSGTSVVLCEHSNTERGFLCVLQQTLRVLFDEKIDIQVSSVDKDPLEIT